MEGEYEFLVDSHTFRVEAGSLLYVPKGTLHVHKNAGDSPGKMLVSQTPGGLYVCFFEEVGEPADGDHGEPPAFEDRTDAGRFVEVAAKHGIEITSPFAD